MEIGIVIIGTNTYLILAIRFIKNFLYFYKGKANITFYLFCDDDPYQYLSAEEGKHVMPFMNNHAIWKEGTNAKFTNILQLKNKLINYIYYFDADTNIIAPFTEDWFIGDLVGGQHFLDKHFRKTDKFPYDYDIRSSCFVDLTTGNPTKYYYGAFFGGRKDQVMKFVTKLLGKMRYNQDWGHEPPWNDESYINAEFYYNPPTKVVPCTEFEFQVSDKGMPGVDTQRKVENTGKPKVFKETCKRHMRRLKDRRWTFNADHKTIEEIK